MHTISVLARGLATARASNCGCVDPLTLAAIREADEWLQSNPVRTELVNLGQRILEAAGIDDGARTVADDPALANLASRHARELIEVGFVTGFMLGHEQARGR